MNRIISTSSLIIIFFFSSFFKVQAQSTQLTDPAFQHGEKITYTVFYNVIGMYVNAGTAYFKTSLEQFNKKDAFHVVAEGFTNKKYDWIFKVRDRYESYFSPDNLLPLKFIRNISEGGFKHHEEVTFDPDQNIAVTKTKKVFKTKGAVLDVINAIYYARSINYSAYAPGDKIPFNMFLGEQVYNMYIRYIGKEVIQTRYGKFAAIKLKPLLLKGSMFDGGENMTLWVTDDANHIPVRAESQITVGSVKIDLMEYNNLRFPLKSLLALGSE